MDFVAASIVVHHPNHPRQAAMTIVNTISKPCVPRAQHSFNTIVQTYPHPKIQENWITSSLN